VYKDLEKLGILFVLLVMIFKVAFFNENIIVLVRVVFALYWLFILPGFLIMSYWKLSFLERLVVGMTLSAAFLGVFGYYLGILGFHSSYQWLLSIPLIIFGVWINKEKINFQKK